MAHIASNGFLGVGGYADVYLGQHQHLGTLAAIKVLCQTLREDEQAAFVSEARLLASLKLPQIIRLLDFGFEDDKPYLVLEYAPGGTLRQRHLSGSRVPIPQVVSYVQPLASALEYAHQQHIVHGDLKPENVLLDAQGQPCLSDFGLAQRFEPHNANSTLSVHEQLAGTPRYQAPEQLRGHPQPASDQYSLAIIVYEWLCGRPPFEGTALQVAMQQVTQAPPPLRFLCPDVSPHLERVVLRALKKESEQRFATIQEFANAFQQAQQTRELSCPRDGLPEHLPPSREDAPRKSAISLDVGRLPVPLTSFIGHRREREEVKGLLAHTRLVTLTGPGGCGKTRFALQLATELRDEFADGVCWVDLTPANEPTRVAQAGASALNIREGVQRSLPETLIALLESRHLLLVLDNCEQVVEACAQLANALLQACPHLSLLISSREALGVPGEQIRFVPTLSIPSSVSQISLEAVQEYEAVQLFVQRAQAQQPAFCLTEQEAPAVVEICQQLEGLPLALELAAARIPLLSPQQIARRLSDRLRLLVSRDRLASPRHRTLYATIEWSYQSLSVYEQRLLCRLSVFIGNFSLEAAETVCAGDDLAGEQIQDLLDLLVRKQAISRSVLYLSCPPPAPQIQGRPSPPDRQFAPQGACADQSSTATPSEETSLSSTPQEALDEQGPDLLAQATHAPSSETLRCSEDRETASQPPALLPARKMPVDEHLLEVHKPSPPPNIQLWALGPVQVARCGETIEPTAWRYAKVKELLFYLLEAPARSKEQIGLALWHDADRSQLRNNLHDALAFLRRALGGSEWVIFEHQRYVFNRLLGLSYDVEQFEAGSAEAQQIQANDPARAISLLEQSIALYRGDFLEDLGTEDWAQVRREELRRRYEQTLQALGQCYNAARLS